MAILRCLPPGLLVLTLAGPVGADDGDRNCFYSLKAPLKEPPFDDGEISTMRSFLLANLNYHGTGGMVASPGETPALYGLIGGDKAGYVYEWTRDSALTAAAIVRLESSRVGRAGAEHRFDAAAVDATTANYERWVRTVVAKDGQPFGEHGTVDAHGEGKWDMATAAPFAGGWCRPQTDGPALRAQALMWIANRSSTEEQRGKLWTLLHFDIDWLLNASNLRMESCDLWEEKVDDDDLFWNRMSMRGALAMCAQVAEHMGDSACAAACAEALRTHLPNPVQAHLRGEASGGVDGRYIVECGVGAEDSKCRKNGKDLDAAVILALTHSGWVDYKQGQSSMAPAQSPLAVVVANTVRQHIEASCEAFPVNRRDTQNALPGVLLGRWPTDAYGQDGKGNPWVLTTAALASLLYQAATARVWQGPLSAPQLAAWRAALGNEAFEGSVSSFIAAGDAVMIRLRDHVQIDGLHLYEQIDRTTGLQYNAKDLSWSYTEVLLAMRERDNALVWQLAQPRSLV